MTDVSPTLWSSLDDISQANRAADKTQEEPTKQEFLRLFMAQLKNQDPLSPMEQKDMAAQLATFSTLEQSVRGNKVLGEIRDSLQSQESYQAANWVGKNIRVDASQLAYEGTGSAALHYDLPAGAANVGVRLVDAEGKLVRGFSAREMGDTWLEPGPHSVQWDGKDLRGQAAAAGNYHLQVEALGADGKPLAGVRTQLVGRLDGVELEGGQVGLRFRGGRVRPRDVLEVL